MSDLQIVDGFPAAARPDAASIYWDAFRGKLGPVLRPEAKALRLLEQVMDPAFAVTALSSEGQVLGIAGYRTAEGGLINGRYKDLTSVYGAFGAPWRGLVLSILERDLEEGVLLMDGIAVSQEARGQGVGSRLLTALKEKAVTMGCTRLRLDVIDSNPRAKALYVREGFVEEETVDIGILRHIFGFQSANKMSCRAAE